MRVPARRTLLISAGVIALGVAAWFGFKGGASGPRGPGPAPVEVSTVKPQPMPVQLRTLGVVQADASVALRSRIDGQVTAVLFNEGDDVKAGQVLFTLDTRAAEATLKQLEAQLAATGRDAARKAQLAKSGTASDAALDQSTAAARGLMAQIEAQKVLIDYGTIRSPFDGRAGASTIKPGAMVRAADAVPLVTINRLSPVDVMFSVSQADLPALRRAVAKGGILVEAQVPGSETVAKGIVNFMDNAVDATTGTISVKAQFENKDLALWPGQSTDVTVKLETVEDTPAAPASSFQPGQDGPVTFVIDAEGKAQLRPVQLWRTVSGTAFIKSGLTPGEVVISDGASRVVPGAKVNIQRKDGVSTAPPAQPGAGSK